MSQTDANLGFPALNSELLPVATAEALNFITTTVGETGQDVRLHMHAFLDGLVEGDDPEYWWGPATAVCLQQEVIDAFLGNAVATGIQAAFNADQSMFLETLASGANIDNPWVLDLDGDGAADAGRAEALDLRVWVLAVSHGGDANHDWSLADVQVTAVGYMESVQDVGGL